ncbi:MAG TPA: lysoplasmalogenase [Stenotrophomonas sp.]|jgi:uncharacterized membrane protein YhhN
MASRAGHSMDVWLASLLILLAAGAIVGASIEGLRWLHYLCKPAATLVIIVRALQGARGPYRRWLLVGLVLSLGGDICLMLPIDAFVAGLAAFLLAHVAYICALRHGVRLSALCMTAPVLAIYAGGNLFGLWPHLPDSLRMPVIAYTVVLASMAAMAFARALKPPRGARRGTGLAALGALLFVASDSLLAWDRFAGPLPWATAGLLASYYAAQWCLASSTPAASSLAYRVYARGR